MNRFIAALERHLEQLVRLNEKLLQLVKDRQKAMTSRDVSRIEALLAEEQKVGMAIFEEERRRRVTMLQLGAELGKKPEQMETVTLAEIAEELGEAHRGRLTALGERLHDLARQTGQANQTMQLLAQRFLPYFEELLGTLLEGCLGQPSYTAEGQVVRAGAAGMNMLDMRI